MEITHPDSERKPSARRAKPAELLDTLRELFPAAFNDQYQPLKLGIHKDIIERLGEIPVRDLKGAFKRYAGTRHYHRNVLEGAVRVDLDGNPAGVVSAEDATHSLATVAGIEARTGTSAPAWERALERARRVRVKSEADAAAWTQAIEKARQARLKHEAKAKHERPEPLPIRPSPHGERHGDPPPQVERSNKRLSLRELKAAGAARRSGNYGRAAP